MRQQARDENACRSAGKQARKQEITILKKWQTSKHTNTQACEQASYKMKKVTSRKCTDEEIKTQRKVDGTAGKATERME